MKAGAKVKCIDDAFVDSSDLPFRMNKINLPKKGSIYTIRDVIDTAYGTGVRLEEIRNKKYFFDDIRENQEPIFGPGRFRILQK